MNRISSILILLIVTSNIFGRPVNGTVESGKNKIEGVVITDGYSFTKSDKSGNFTLDISDKADFVYIITPSGYTACRENGITQFYKKIESNISTFNFELMPLANSGKFVLIAVGDPQTKTEGHYKLFEDNVLSDIKGTINYYAKQNIPVITLYLGDVVWDSMPLFENHKKGIKQLDIPVYSAIGNHDYQKELTGDKQCSIKFSECFGPTYYGFNLGNNYFIVLDNIIYDTNKKYVEDLDQTQIDWLKNYIKYIPENGNVYVVMHAPVNKLMVGIDKIARGHRQILGILSDYNLSFITGHIHTNSNEEILPGVIEHNVASACGAWWQSFYAPDGTPSGYQVFELNNKKTEWFYKTINKDRDFQMELYPRGSFADKSNAIVAKIWNWDPKWKVEFYEDG